MASSLQEPEERPGAHPPTTDRRIPASRLRDCTCTAEATACGTLSRQASRPTRTLLESSRDGVSEGGGDGPRLGLKERRSRKRENGWESGEGNPKAEESLGVGGPRDDSEGRSSRDERRF